MGIFGKSKGKSYSFDYSIQVHSLRPWLATGGPMFISWQRGSSKRGNTAPVNPTTTPGVSTAEYRFEDRLNISATLYSEGYKGKDDTSIGPFSDKWLILSLVGAGRGKGREQGQVVVNLAHYAAIHNEARQGFTVAVTDKRVTQQLGEIVLEVTIGCQMRTKKKGKMTFTGTSNASSSGLQRTGSEISDSDYGSDIGDDGYGAPAGSIMESIREEDYAPSPGAVKAQRHAEMSRFGPGPLEPVPEPIPEQSVSPRESEIGSKRPSDTGAGPARPLAAQGNAGKAAKYDEDGFLLDDDEEVPQPPAASRPPPPTRPVQTVPKPPSEYDLAYDSSPAPSPRASQLNRNQKEVPSTAGLASRQAQPQSQSTADSAPRDLASQISRLAEEESDEDDFLAAAVAAVEAQDQQKAQPAAAQRAQQAKQAPASPYGQTAPQQRQQEQPQASPMAVQNQQTRQSVPDIPPAVPKTWQRPGHQSRPSVDSEDTPQRSEQSLRSRYGVQRSSPSAASDASGGAAAAFLAARTGSGTAPPPEIQPQAMSSRPLLGGAPNSNLNAQQQRPPGPVPLARPPTAAYNAAPANTVSAPASDARPSSKWFRKTPPVAPPAQPQPPPQPKPVNDTAYNPFESPTKQNGDGSLSPMAIANQQQQQQQQKPRQEPGVFMDESDEEEEQRPGRFGAQQGYGQQQGQMNRVSPQGAITAGTTGTGAEAAREGPGSPPWLQQNGPSSPAYSDESILGGGRGLAKTPSQVERIRQNMEAQSQNRADFGPTHRPIIGVSHQTSPTLNRDVPDRGFARQDSGQQQMNGESAQPIRSWARKLDSSRDPQAATRKAEEEQRLQKHQRAQEEERQRIQAQEEEQTRLKAREEEQARIRAEEEQQAKLREEEERARRKAEEEQQARKIAEQQEAKRRAEEEQRAKRRAEEEQRAKRRAEEEQLAIARRRAEEQQQAQIRAAEQERARREAEAEEQLRREAEEEERLRQEEEERERLQEAEATERRRKRAEEEEAAWLRHDEEQKAAAAAASAAAIAETAKSMATPQTGMARGMSRGISRDLGLQQGPQQGISDLPPDFNYSQIESMVRELRTAAALEASVYLARSGKGNARRVKARSVHAPARRLARTTITLGPDEGIAFGLRAVRAIEAAADGCSDVVGMAYWWSNCIQLRWMLWAMCHGGEMSEDGSMAEDAPGMDEFDWVMKVLVPPLRELETYIFERLFRYLWQKALLESVSREPSGGPLFSPHMMTPTHKASAHEDAIQRWLDALQDTHRTLMPAKHSATSGHVTLLKQKMLTAILRRLDSVLFDKLTASDSVGGLSADSRDVFSSAWKNPGHNRNASTASTTGGVGVDPPLDPKLLPFSKGPLSFGVGVNLKMAVSRWTDWAHDAGVREEKGVLEGYSFFPQLRATADLLMMPKEVLTDRTIRAEVLPGLSLGRICSLLERFQPDDFAADPLPRGLLTTLHNETPPSEVSPKPTARLEAGYEPPSESQLLADGLIEPVSLEMDAESDDELDALSEMYDPHNKGEETRRYTLLRELWSSAR